MTERKFKPIDWVEPAHPDFSRIRDLTAIYSFIKQKYQVAIDAAFDKVSSKIGFVVTTTLPIVVDVNERGTVQNISVGADNLRETLFESEVVSVLSTLKKETIKVTPGSYTLYLLWRDALQLKLKRDWVEPAHYLKDRYLIKERYLKIVPPEVMEPAHWFDSRIALRPEETMIISVIDEVYPELNLASRINAIREQGRNLVRQEAIETAQFDRIDAIKDNPAELLKTVKALLEKY
jgi:hypothetical protein